MYVASSTAVMQKRYVFKTCYFCLLKGLYDTENHHFGVKLNKGKCKPASDSLRICPEVVADHPASTGFLVKYFWSYTRMTFLLRPSEMPKVFAPVYTPFTLKKRKTGEIWNI